MRRASKQQAEEIRALRRVPDGQIDSRDIPPVADWSKAVVGKFYRPVSEFRKPRRGRQVGHGFEAGAGVEDRTHGIERHSAGSNVAVDPADDL